MHRRVFIFRNSIVNYIILTKSYCTVVWGAREERDVTKKEGREVDQGRNGRKIRVARGGSIQLQTVIYSETF